DMRPCQQVLANKSMQTCLRPPPRSRLRWVGVAPNNGRIHPSMIQHGEEASVGVRLPTRGRTPFSWDPFISDEHCCRKAQVRPSRSNKWRRYSSATGYDRDQNARDKRRQRADTQVQIHDASFLLRVIRWHRCAKHTLRINL